MRKEKTWSEKICERIKELRYEPFITWKMLKISPYNESGRHHLTYEGKLTFEMMEKLEYRYVRYGVAFSDSKFDKRVKGFKPPSSLKRDRSIKLHSIQSSSED